jgi:hypothetical protein
MGRFKETKSAAFYTELERVVIERWKIKNGDAVIPGLGNEIR